jgi:hypothetical protein
MKNLLAIFAFSFLLFACNNESISPNLANLEGQGNLIGVWEYDAYEQLTDSTYAEVYRKVKRIASDKSGITFKNNGVFLSKQNAGWCGTPPISYAEYDGKFNVIGKNLININSTYWGGKMSYKAEVLELTNSKLKVKPFDYEYEERGF